MLVLLLILIAIVAMHAHAHVAYGRWWRAVYMWDEPPLDDANDAAGHPNGAV